MLVVTVSYYKLTMAGINKWLGGTLSCV